MSSKKILTIDFDIIMYPCLQIYNDLVSGDANPTESWEFLKRERGLEPFIRYDANTLLMIGKIIKAQIAKNAILIPCSEHQQVVDKLKLSESYDTDMFSITNIDFHHDIWYRPDDKSILINFDDYNCSNWLGYLLLKNKVENISWYKAYNSTPFFDNEYTETIPLNSFRLDELETLIEEQFDEVYFVLSPQWVPYEFQHLYNLIIALVKGE